MRTTGPRSFTLALLLLLGLPLWACDKSSPTEPRPPACTFSLSKTSLSFGATGGSDSVNVATASNCTWSAASDQGWMTISGGASGTGSGVVQVAVAANSNESVRTGTLRIAGILVAVSEDGLPPCSVSISPDRASFTKDAATGTFTVSALPHCPWSAASNAPWIALTSGSPGSGNGPVGYAIQTNREPTPRTGTISIGGGTFTVMQSGDTPQCTYTVSPVELVFGSGGGSDSVTVTTATNCSWTAADDHDWITVANGASGTGDGTVRIDVLPNPTDASRMGTLTVAGQGISVRQDARTGSCDYLVQPVDVSACMTAPTLSVSVTTQAGCTWTATAADSWITLLSGQSGAGSGVITFRVSDNYTDPRQGTVSVRWPTPTAGQNVRISQAGCRYAVSVASINIPVAGGSDRFNVITASDPITCGGPLQDRCVWTATSDVPWISITTTMPQSGDNPVSFTVAPNGTGATRTGRITVRDKVVVVTQAGS